MPTPNVAGVVLLVTLLIVGAATMMGNGAPFLLVGIVAALFLTAKRMTPPKS